MTSGIISPFDIAGAGLSISAAPNRGVRIGRHER